MLIEQENLKELSFSTDLLLENCLNTESILLSSSIKETQAEICVMWCRDCAEVSALTLSLLKRSSPLIIPISKILYHACQNLINSLKELKSLCPETIQCIKTALACSDNIADYLKKSGFNVE